MSDSVSHPGGDDDLRAVLTPETLRALAEHWSDNMRRGLSWSDAFNASVKAHADAWAEQLASARQSLERALTPETLDVACYRWAGAGETERLEADKRFIQEVVKHIDAWEFDREQLEAAERALSFIADIAADRDGYTGDAEKLGQLVDEMRRYALDPTDAARRYMGLAREHPGGEAQGA